MKKVLLTVNNNKLSGIEKFTLLLAGNLDKNKYSVEVGVPVYGPFCKILEDNNIEYFIFDNKVIGDFTISGFKYMYKKLKKEKYDIIHAQAGIAPCVIGKLTECKLLIEHKHGLDFTSEQINNMDFLKRTYQKLKKYFVMLTLTGCEADKNILIRRFNYDDSKVKVIYNGIEKEIIEFPKHLNEKFTIGTIGRLTFQKGQEYFVEMAKILQDRGLDFEYYIYGEGEELNNLNELILKYKLSENVFLKGYAYDIPLTINTFDLFVLPSRYEGIPYVILEAMKGAVPVITTDVGGISEVIRNNHNGILVKKENAEELANNVIELYNSPEKRKLLSVNARKDFLEKYTLEKTISDIESIYSKVD